MNCPFCDKPGEPIYDFCPHCKHEWVHFTEEPEPVTPYPMNCSRCHDTMVFARREELQRSSFANNLFFGEMGELFKGTLKLNMFVCPTCKKVEFELTQ